MERTQDKRREGAGEGMRGGGATLAITRETTRVGLSSQHLEITVKEGEEGEERTSTVPLANVGRVVVCGCPRITFQAVLRLAAEGIPCFFLSESGRWKASLQGVGAGDAERRMLQCRRAGDAGFSLAVARGLVAAKVRNSRRVLQRLAANRGASGEAGHRRACAELREAAWRVREAGSLEEARGLEGRAAAVYFGRLSGNFPAAFPFAGRNRHPPRDAANAVLSFAYGVLAGEVEGALRVRGLDPAPGHLHAPGARPSLALDLMEPFRPAVADLLALDLLNHGMLEEERHFVRRGDGAVLLSEAGRKVFFVRYGRAMERRFRPRNDAPPTTFRQLVGRTVQDYLSALGSGVAPEFFLLP